MIRLNRVTKVTGRKGHRRRVLNEVDWTIRLRSQFVLLSVHHTDCSTFLDIVSGAQLPTTGWVDRQCRVLYASWIRAVTSGQVTPRQLMVNLSTIYRVEAGTLIGYVDDFADIGSFMTVPIRLLPTHIRQRLGVALVYSLPADFYLFDSKLQLGLADMKDRCLEAFHARRRQAGMILATSHVRHARQFGGAVGILHQGSVYVPRDPEDAFAAFEKLVIEEKKNDNRKKMLEDPNDTLADTGEGQNIDFMI